MTQTFGMVMTTEIIMDEMGEKITEGIKDKLIAGGLEFTEISFQELIDRQTGALARPVANISINQGNYVKVTANTVYKQNTTVSLYIMVQNLSGEKEVRKGMYLLIHAIARVLLFEKLGLDLQDPLIPRVFNNVTDGGYAKAGYLVYQLDLTCSFNFTKDAEKDEGAFTKIYNDYFLQDPVDDGVVDLQGIVLLNVIDGGYSGSTFTSNVVDGGYAGTWYMEEPEINGGKAGTTY